MLNKTIYALQELAQRECADEEDMMSGFGGNTDDAYSQGVKDGETELAKKILTDAV